MTSNYTVLPALYIDGTYLSGFRLGNLPDYIPNVLSKYCLNPNGHGVLYALPRYLPIGAIFAMNPITRVLTLGGQIVTWEAHESCCLLVDTTPADIWASNTLCTGLSVNTSGNFTYDWNTMNELTNAVPYLRFNVERQPLAKLITGSTATMFLLMMDYNLLSIP